VHIPIQHILNNTVEDISISDTPHAPSAYCLQSSPSVQKFSESSYIIIVCFSTKIVIVVVHRFCHCTHLCNIATHWCECCLFSNVLKCVSASCSVLQCVAVCCSVLQCVALCCCEHRLFSSVLQRVAVGCSVLQFVAASVACCRVCCTVFQRVIVCSSVLHSHCIQLFNITTCDCERRSFSCVFQCVAVCCSVLQCVE